MIHSSSRNFFIRSLLPVVAVALFFAATAVRAGYDSFFTETYNAAPGGPIAPPLNGSLSAQTTAGTLIVGYKSGATPRVFCLNASVVNGVGTRLTLDQQTTDPVNTGACVKSWAEVRKLYGTFASIKSIVTIPNQNESRLYPFELNPNNYSRQYGYASVQATPDQAYATLVTAPNLCREDVCVTDNSPCIKNTDCRLPGGVPGGKYEYYVGTGVYASDSYSLQYDAAHFAGRLSIQGLTSPLQPGQLCWNGDCKNSWDQVIDKSNNYVMLSSKTVPDIQSGGSAVTGIGVFSSAVIGTIEPLVKHEYSCGDGYCSGNESPLTCPIDCAPVSPPASLLLTPGDGQAVVAETTSNGNPDGERTVVTVRAANADSDFLPQLGRTYAVGEVFGNSTVVDARLVNGNSVPFTFTDTGLTNGTMYSYRSFQGNAMLRYSTSYNTSTVTPTPAMFTLTVQVNSPGGDYVLINPGSIACTSTCNPSNPRNTVVTLQAYVQNGHTFNGWSGACTGVAGTCQVTMTANKSVTAVFTGGGGGGGGEDHILIP